MTKMDNFVIKGFLIYAAVMVALLFSSTRHESAYLSSSKTLDMAKFAFETGCLEESKIACSDFEDKLRSDCFADALADCPKMSRAFQEWLKRGKR